ncbi:MAG: hypothetical protein ACYC27_23350 [Armatimonadota bacterium]
MKKSYLPITALVVIFVSMPSTAHANMGTPLMWAEALHLYIGNLIIGLVEGLLIMLLLGSKINPKHRIAAPGIMILANYVSAGIGCWVIRSGAGRFIDGSGININTPHNSIMIYVSTVILSFFAATVLIEWPFCLWLLKGLRYKGRMALTSLKISMIAQIVSYALLILLYHSASDMSVFTKLDADPSLSFVRNPDTIVYLLSESDGDVYRINANGKGMQKAFDTNSTDPSDTLYLWNTKDSKSWKLSIGIRESGKNGTLLQDSFSKIIPPCDDWDEKKDKGDSWPPSEFYAMDLRPLNDRNWEIFVDFWARNGMQVDDKVERKSVLEVGLETPFMQWDSKYATVLPGDQVIYQLGKQIVILDPHSKKIGLIAYGRSPVVKLNGEYKE